MREAEKAPMKRHAGKAKWEWDDADAFVEKNQMHKAWGMLLDGLVVVDADDEETVAWVEGELGKLPEAEREGCAVQETKKGRHYVFLRPEWADGEGYYDGARQVEGRKVDMKTKCSTGTRGLLSVAPTEGKRWMRAPWELGPCGMVYMPRVLMEKVAKGRRAKGVGVKVVGVKGVEVKHQAPPDMPASFVESRPVEKLLLLLGKSRWESYTTWRDIATALKNSYGEKYRETWDRLSRMSPNYTAESACKTWETVCKPGYEGPRLTVGTLEVWARQDDPHGYALYRASTIPGVVKERWDKGDLGLGQVTYELLKATVKKTGPGRGDYYSFEEVSCRWAKVDEGRVKSVASLALEEVMRDVEVWLAAQSTQCGMGENEVLRKAELDAKKREAALMVKYVRSHRGITNVMGFAGPLFMDETFEQRLDSERHLMGIKGGCVVDLRTGASRRRVAEDMVHNELDVEYTAGAPVPPWMYEMVEKMMGGETALAVYLQRLLGYGITGEVREEVFPIWTGSGRNGKGLLTQAMQQLLGSYYREMNCAIISDSRVCGNIDAERAKLLGARLAVFNELKPGEKLKTNEVQLLTGGDGIPAKALYKDPITVMPRHMALLVTNYMPEMGGEVIVAMIERLLVIPFPVTFRDLMPGEKETPMLRQCDKTLKDRLKSAEGQSALFAWLVEGAVAWYAGGESLRRSAPAKVREFTRSYLEEQDRVRSFLTEHCEFGEGMRVSSTDLFYRYQATNEEATNKWFHAQMKVKGFVKKTVRVKGGTVTGYDGLRLIRVEQGANMDDLELS
jgi:P4 family phage/plasmid primase-like protien